jgi:tRNA (guanine-N7-)-methyltransferase
LRLYGRRRGRRLREGRRALTETLLPVLRVPLGVPGTLDPAALFPFEPREIRLEIGFGAGEHLVHQAKAEPTVGFIGCEVFVNGVAALLARVKADNLGNVRILDDDARLLFKRLPEASLDRIVALFPDPWPKTRHHRRRLIQRESLDAFARLLKDGGEFRFATDHMEYARWTLVRCLRHPAFAWAARGPQDWRGRPQDSPQTRYETKARARGRACVYLVFRRVPRIGEGLPRPLAGDI